MQFERRTEASAQARLLRPDNYACSCNFRVARKNEAVSNDSLQVSESEFHVRAFPSGLKFHPHPFRVGDLVLGFQALPEPKQRTGISMVLFRIGAKHCFRLRGF